MMRYSIPFAEIGWPAERRAFGVISWRYLKCIWWHFRNNLSSALIFINHSLHVVRAISSNDYHQLFPSLTGLPGGTSGSLASPGCKGAGTYCFGDVLLSRSTTGGSTWSPPLQVNDNDPLSLADHLFPGLAVDNTGGVRVVFYDRRSDSRNFLIDTFVATSLNAGASWTNTKVTPNSFPSIHAQDLVVNPAYMGDYLGIAAVKLAQQAGVIAAWGDNSLGDPNVASAKQIP